MRKKLETFPLSELKAIAKENQLKNVSTLRKAELIDRLCALHEERTKGAEKKEVISSVPEVPSQIPSLKEPEKSVNAAEEKNENSADAVKNVSEEQNRKPYGQNQEGETRRPREYRPRNSEFAQRAAGNSWRPQGQQMRQGMNRPQRPYDYNQRQERRPYNRPYTRGDESGQADQTVKSQAENAETLTAEVPVNRETGIQDVGAAGMNLNVAKTGTDELQMGVVRDNRSEFATTETKESETGAVSRMAGDENTKIESEAAKNSLGEDGAASKTSGENSADSEFREDIQALDSGIVAQGILEVMPEGFGFIRSANYLPGDEDVYVAPSQIRRFKLKTGDIITGMRRIKTSAEKFAALLYLTQVNGYAPSVLETRPNFEDLTPIFPDYRLHLERPGGTKAMRIVDLLSPIGKGQRGMIVSQPKAGKTTLLKDVAKAITINHPDMHLIVLLIDERPEEVTDIKESIAGENVEVIYSTFDELPEHHKRVSEMVLERAKRLVEHGRDVMILLDSITRLARAYNLTVAPSGRTLSGGLDPAALYMPKRFFGAARNMREGGSLTVLATALVDTGSRMDDVVFEEFKGTGNMELVLNRKLSEKRIFPAIDIMKSGTRRDDLLLTPEERAAADFVHKITAEGKGEEAAERVLNLFSQTRTNREFIAMIGKWKF